jgi:methylated-DNA-[protein]-cysteine S-methyltransferase
MNDLFRGCLESPIGLVEIEATEGEIVRVEFAVKKSSAAVSKGSPALEAAVRQLDEYFRGQRRVFELMLRLDGTDFQTSVWRALLEVGFGETASYGEIARTIGRPASTRAVGAANGRNPISIIVPCHRIIGSSGALTGYGGGLWRKDWLLRHERDRVEPQLFRRPEKTRPDL